MSDAAPAGAGTRQDRRSSTEEGGPDADGDGDGGEGDEAPVRGRLRPQPREVTREPATLSGALALGAAALVTLLGGVYYGPALAAGALGIAAIALAFSSGSRRSANAAGLALGVATLLAGLEAPAPATLAIAVATILAWDLINNAIDVGLQLGREADTTRAELAHAGASVGVGAVTAGFAFVVYRFATGGQPATALVFLLLAAVVLVSALRL